MKTTLKYMFFDPNTRDTTDALLAVCMECCREKAEAAIHNAALECVPTDQLRKITRQTK